MIDRFYFSCTKWLVPLSLLIAFADISAQEKSARPNSFLYLMNEEVIAGELISIDEARVIFHSDVTGQVTIPCGKVRAVDIDHSIEFSDGFSDAGWVLTTGSQENLDSTLEKERAVLRKNGFGHPTLLGAGGRVRFHAKAIRKFGTFTMRLFCGDFSKDDPSTNLLFSFQGTRLLVGRVKSNRSFTFGNVHAEVVDQEADIEVALFSNKVRVSVNRKVVYSIDVKTKGVSGDGVAFEAGGAGPDVDKNRNEFEISKFTISRTPGEPPLSQIALKLGMDEPGENAESSSRQTLFLLNGNGQAGTLKEVGNKRIQFNTKDKVLDLPLSEVDGIIWHQTAQPNAHEANFLATHEIKLHDGSQLKLAAERIEEGSDIFEGRSEILGICKVPLKSIRHLRQAPPRDK